MHGLPPYISISYLIDPFFCLLDTPALLSYNLMHNWENANDRVE